MVDKERTIQDLMPPKILGCLIEILYRVMSSGYGEVTIRVINGKPVFILEMRSYHPEDGIERKEK